MILADFQVNGQFPSKVATSGTSNVYFPRTFGTTFNVAPSTPTAANATGQLNLPGSQYFNATQGQRLRVVVAGSIWTAANQTATITVQINTGTLTSPTYATLMTCTSPSQSGRISYMLEGHMVIAGNASLSTDAATAGYQLNSGSPAPLIQGQLSGSFFGNVDQTAVALVTMGAIPTVTLVNTNGGSASPNVSGLVVLASFSVGTAGNNATLSEFAIMGD